MRKLFALVAIVGLTGTASAAVKTQVIDYKFDGITLKNEQVVQTQLKTMMRDRLETMPRENFRSLMRLEAMVLLQRHPVDNLELG